MHWILDNKEWLFSGVGVAILGGLLTLFLRHRPARTSENTSAARTPANISTVEGSSMIASPVATGSNISQNVSISLVAQSAQTPDEYSTRPTPQEIFSQLNTLPLFQRTEAAKTYIGIKVRWRGTFFSMDDVRTHVGYGRRRRDDEDTHFVFMSTGGGSLIKVPVHIERLPRLKVTHEGTQMEARGVIEEVGATILLKDVALSFVD